MKHIIKIKTTKYYYAVIVLIVALFVAGYVHNNNLAFIAMFFLFSISLISIVFGRLNIKNAQIFLNTNRIFANKKTKLSYRTHNFIGNVTDDVFFKKRGKQKLCITLSSDYPLKIVNFSKKICFDFIVYPELKGENLEKYLYAVNDETEFEGLKQYNNEDIKYIYWPSIAKDEIHIKNFKGENEFYELIFDYSKIKGNKEEKISQIALWSYESFTKGYRFKIILPEIIIESEEGFDEIFKKLALY